MMNDVLFIMNDEAVPIVINNVDDSNIVSS